MTYNFFYFSVDSGIKRVIRGSESVETSKFCEMVDQFFDCFNVKSASEANLKRKSFKQPYRDANDERFRWLHEYFLVYFDCWKEQTQERPGDFSQKDRNKMFISWQTYQGLHITTNSIVEATKFLLREGCEYILTERFCQDPLEQYFGNQRKLGRRSENPDLYQVGYFDNTIRVQKSISCTSGNTSGRYDSRNNWINITDEKVPKRK